MAGITSYGAYIPYYRLPRSVVAKAWGKAGGRGERAVANADEDANTMAVAAGLDCLNGVDPKTVDALFLATTCSPYKERLNSIIVSTALDMRMESRKADFTNCIKAGTMAMSAALDAINGGSARSVMITAADMRPSAASGENELDFGDGGAAVLMGNENVVAEIEGSYSLFRDFPDYWRRNDDDFVRVWEDRWGLDEGYRKFPVEAATGVMEKCGLSVKDISKVCFNGPNSRRHGELAKLLGLQPEQVQDSLLDTVGNAGTALPLMVLVAALEEAKPGDRILLISYGNGSDAFVLKVTDEIEKIRDRRGVKGHLEIKKTLDNYQRYLRWRGLVTLEARARPDRHPVSVSSLWRQNRNAMALYGGKCKKCGTPQLYLNFPSLTPRICLECHAKDEFEDYQFAGKKSKIVTYSHDHLAAVPDPPNTITVIDFEGGGRGFFEMTDRDPEEVKVGLPMEMTFRNLFSAKEGVHNYFWKCKPYRGSIK